MRHITSTCLIHCCDICTLNFEEDLETWSWMNQGSRNHKGRISDSRWTWSTQSCIFWPAPGFKQRTFGDSLLRGPKFWHPWYPNEETHFKKFTKRNIFFEHIQFPSQNESRSRIESSAHTVQNESLCTFISESHMASLHSYWIKDLTDFVGVMFLVDTQFRFKVQPQEKVT